MKSNLKKQKSDKILCRALFTRRLIRPAHLTMSQAASITNGSAGAPPSAPEKPKSEKQLKYEAKKAKQAQQQQQQAAAGSGKVKEKKSKDAPESIASRYVEKTPPGQKKSRRTV